MDQFIQHWINREMTSPVMDQLMAGITNYSAWFPFLVVGVIAGLIFGNFRMRVMLLCLGIALGITDGIVVNGLKHAVGRARPLQVEPGVRNVHLAPSKPGFLALVKPPKIKFPVTAPFGTVVEGRSFPSSHSSNIMMIATVIFLFYRRWGMIAYFIALLVCYARIYTGAHWPSDVLAGALLGIIIGVIVVRLIDWAWRKWGVHLAPTLAARHPEIL